MGDEDKDQRTEDPTEKRRQDSFEKGRTATSREVSSTVVLLVTVSVLYATGGSMRNTLENVMHSGFSTFFNMELTVDVLRPLLMHYLGLMLAVLAPIMVATAVTGIVINLAQNGGFILSLDPISPKWNKVNPFTGFGRFFSKQALMELMKSLFKISIVGSVAYYVLLGEWEQIPNLVDWEVEQLILFVSWVSIKLMVFVLLVMIFLAAADFAFQKYTFEDSLKMTKQEVKDERKNSEGDPQVKSRIRNTQMQMARRRMMQDVPKAEVIITNPTHLAIAIAYDRFNMAAPVIVAKGAGLVAERIKEIAKENEIPVVEDKPLARILFKTVGIGEMVPEDLFKAIAEILAYVYRLKGRRL